MTDVCCSARKRFILFLWDQCQVGDPPDVRLAEREKCELSQGSQSRNVCELQNTTEVVFLVIPVDLHDLRLRIF
jgi:hypothetical protein